MGAAAMRIGEAMGWFVARAGERQRNLKTAGTIAALAWKAKPQGSLGSQEALANRLRALDAGNAREWWLGAKGKPYLDAVAGVLKVEPRELIAWIEGARPAPDDDARWFRFEVFPGLAPLDLDAEEPYPGVPRMLWRGDGPRGPTWWHAAPGAGRTLVGRWLARRHGWSFVSSLSEPSERTFVEHDSADLGDRRLPDRIVIASPHPMPDRLRAQRWEEIRGETGWELDLLEWANARLTLSGRFDTERVSAAVAHGRLGASTPGALLEALAELHVLGPDILEEDVPPARALEAWANAHAAREDRVVRPASRAWLRERGGWLLPRIELTRLIGGLPFTDSSVVACVPTLPHASADAIQEAYEAEDVDAALALIRPGPQDLVAAMSGLRWILPNDWGLPSRLMGHLRAAVVDLALDEGDDIRALGSLLDRPEIAAQLVRGLAEPNRLGAWLGRLGVADPSQPTTALAADGLLKAFALVAGRRSVPVEGLAAGLAIALRAAYGRSCPDLGVEACVADAQVWTALGWLTLYRYGVLEEPSPEQSAGWASHAGEALGWRDAFRGSNREQIRGLAADTLGAIVHADPRWRWAPRSVVALAELVDGGEADGPGLAELSRLAPLDVVERLCAPWASSIDDICRLLWPLWTETGLPFEENTAENIEALRRVWATYPGNPESVPLRGQLIKHAALGVAIPDRLWRTAILTEPWNPALLARAPIDVLVDCGRSSQSHCAPAVWARAPERALALLPLVVSGEFDEADEGWLASVPPERALEVLEVLRNSASPSGRLAARRFWADRAIRDRVAGWESVWMWVRTLEQ